MQQFDFIGYTLQKGYGRFAVDGRTGAGKTNLAVYMVTTLKRITKQNVYSNIWLSYKYRKLTKDMIKTLPPELNNCIMLIDEIHMWGGDSYKFLSKQSEELTLLFTQLRKRKITLIYTVQHYTGMIAVRLRKNTDMLFHCTEASNLTASMLPYNKKGETLVTSGVEVHFIDEFTGEPLEAIHVFLFDGKPFWKYYDTDEIVT